MLKRVVIIHDSNRSLKAHGTLLRFLVHFTTQLLSSTLQPLSLGPQMNQPIYDPHPPTSAPTLHVSGTSLFKFSSLSRPVVFAWCIQHIQPQATSTAQGEQPKKKNPTGKIRITCFWQHDLKALWGFGSSSGSIQQLSTMTLGLLKTVLKRGSHVPKLTGYGHGVSIERVQFQIDREALTIDYVIIPEDDDHSMQTEHLQGMDEVHALREQRRLTRSIECVLPSSEGWDVQVTTKASSSEVEQLPWTAHAIRSSSFSSPSSPHDQIILRLSHAALLDDHSVLKVRVVIEVSGPSSGLRLNGLPQTIQDIEDRDPSSYFISEQILQDVSSAADLSFHTTSSLGTVNSNSSTSPSIQNLVRPAAERTAAADKSILSRVRRNYIYFSSLLQEPEAKWRRSTWNAPSF